MKQILLLSLVLAVTVLAACSMTAEDSIVEVVDFATCVAAGNPIMESYPEQCAHDGVTYENEVQRTQMNQQAGCEAADGVYSEKFQECEGIDPVSCENLGGTFNECASACRNQPGDRICTMQCIVVCDFAPEADLAPVEELPPVDMLAIEAACTQAGGTYLADFAECEYISKDTCDSLGGEFNECASACRNDPDAEMCTMQCIVVCDFAAEATLANPDIQNPINPLEEETLEAGIETHVCTDEELSNMICTREYNPVCGDDGNTHATGCTACASGTVTEYTQGEC